MPRYERPKPSVTADYGEIETASVWGLDDDIQDVSPTEAQLLGIYPPAPATPRVKGYDETEPLLPVIGSREKIVNASNDGFYARKLAAGLFDTPKK
jgi:hypothetical protein